MTAYKRALRRNRHQLRRDLPEIEALLSNGRLKPCFTKYEHESVRSYTVPSDRAAALLDLLEIKDYHVYETFLDVLRTMKPDLAAAVESTERSIRDSSAGSSPCSEDTSAPPLGNMVNGDHSPQRLLRHPQLSDDGTEDAGPFGLTGHGPGPAHRLTHLSYAGREFLADKLNGTPQDRNTFNNFCLALGVEQRLVQVSMRSRNPTGYLIQEYQERPEATFDKLEQALSDIGQHDLFHQLQAVDNGPM